VGSIDYTNIDHLSTLSSSIWSINMHKSYMGCVSELIFNGIAVDLVAHLNAQHAIGVELG
jgi:hypothetical protein